MCAPCTLFIYKFTYTKHYRDHRSKHIPSYIVKSEHLLSFAYLKYLSTYSLIVNNDMSRKTRSSEVLEQLGEPLPLPYMADLPRQRVEETPNTSSSPSTNPLSEHFKRGKVRISSGETRGNSPPLSRDNPMKQRRFRQIETELEQETIFDEIQLKMAMLKQKHLLNSNLALDEGALKGIKKTIDELLNRYNENDIFNEIDRLRLQEELLSSVQQNTKLWPFIIIVAISCLLIASFLAGQFSYEYCYYFC